jgi:hypothetical protein
MSEETNQPQELSKEEIAKRRAEITAFYKESIEHLKIQEEYETLLLKIEEARAKRIQAQIALAQFYGAQDSHNEEAADDFERAQGVEQDLPKRTLRRTE